jgi:ribose 5-phosphate isomerase RpiB
MGARLIGTVTAVDALDAWLTSPLGEGRHLRRIEKIAVLDEQAQL